MAQSPAWVQTWTVTRAWVSATGTLRSTDPSVAGTVVLTVPTATVAVVKARPLSRPRVQATWTKAWSPAPPVLVTSVTTGASGGP